MLDSLYLNQTYETFGLFKPTFGKNNLKVLFYKSLLNYCHTVVDLATSLRSSKQNFHTYMHQCVGLIFLVHGLPGFHGSKLNKTLQILKGKSLTRDHWHNDLRARPTKQFTLRSLGSILEGCSLLGTQILLTSVTVRGVSDPS